jgi:hypothetical protein
MIESAPKGDASRSVGRRLKGEAAPSAVARATYQLGAQGLELIAETNAPAHILELARVHTALGLKRLREIPEHPLVTYTYRALDGKKAQFWEGAEHFADIDETGSIGIAADLVEGWNGEAYGLLSVMAHVHAATCLETGSQREGLHRALDISLAITARYPDLRDELSRLLKTAALDHQNTFAIFMESAVNAKLALEMEGMDLGSFLWRPMSELRESAGQPDAVIAAITAAIKWRDKWVTWVIGQDLVDLPYDKERVFRLLEEREGEDIDAKRRIIHQEISSTYDRQIEGANIERLARQIEAEGRMIVCGRISRAFGNQTQLLSNASYVDRTALRPLAIELETKTRNWTKLGPQVSRLLKLIRQPGNTSCAQLKGALWHFEEALRELQSTATKAINAAREADSDKLVGRQGFGFYQRELERLSAQVSDLFALSMRLREVLEGSAKNPAAFLILQQRFFPGETQLLALANANRDTHPGKIEVLRDLTRKGGHNRYASEGFGVILGADGKTRQVSWIAKCQHWIEAIPMFIKERIVKVPVVQGGQQSFVERIETEVDQRGMEAFFRYAAEHWADNCKEVADSEHVALAREWLASRVDPRSCTDRIAAGTPADDAFLAVVQSSGLLPQVGSAAAIVAASAEALIDSVAIAMEKRGLSRIEALRAVLVSDQSASAQTGNLIAGVTAQASDGAADLATALVKAVGDKGLGSEAERLASLAEQRLRPVSTLHVLTTESAGMTEGYVQTWLETEMALYNVIEAHGWHAEVQERVAAYRTRVIALAEKVVAELGMEAVVQEMMIENGAPRAAALNMVMSMHRPVSEEVSRLAVLIEEDERQGVRPVDWNNVQDPTFITEYIDNNRESLVALALPKIVEGNGRALQQQVDVLMADQRLGAAEATRAAIAADADFSADLEFFVRSFARQTFIEEKDRALPELNILKTQADYLRNHTQLALSTARRAVVARHGAQALTEDPRYNFRATGGKKRYNLLYTPSRVDLGAEEMDSIVRWNQWVGGADQAACNAGREFYGLINEAGVEVRPALAWQEIQKTSENANMTAGKAFANAVALLISSVDEGDQQLMADQMALRHDADRGTPAASEGYGGYCVPKDGLFLAFVLELRSETKLRQMGVPPSMHQAVMNLAREAILHYGDFETDFEWQRWVGQKLLSPEELRHYLSEYVGIRQLRDEDLLVFNLSKISESIERLGQPWQDITAGERLLSNLAAQWAVGKMIIGGEQVQRFMVFFKAWLIARALREADREGVGRVVIPAEYKAVQDIRYSGGIRIFEILSQTAEHLTYSLDEEGQNLVFLMMVGFTPLTALEKEAAAIAKLPVGSEERLRRQKTFEKRRRVTRRIYEVYSLDETRDAIAIEELATKFPPVVPPADVRLVSSTMASTQDIFYYTDDTQLTQIADRTMQTLADLGLSEAQMRANAEVYGGDLSRWTAITNLPVREREALLSSPITYRVGNDTFEVPIRGAIHPLVTKLLGPARTYETAVQGADVLNTSIAFNELLDLIDDPSKLVALMLEGNPRSAIAITDGISGRGSRMLTYRDVMLFFAACDTLAGPGRGSYRAIGLGDQVVARLRAEMVEKRERAAELLRALEAVVRVEDEPALETASAEARAVWRRMLERITASDEAIEAIAEEERARRYKRVKPRDRIITETLTRVASGLDLPFLDFASWLALGGAYVVVGQPEGEIEALRTRFELGLDKIKPIKALSLVPPAETETVVEALKALIRPRFIPEIRAFAQVLGRESSSKAVHVGESEARERRRALRDRHLRIEAFARREKGFQQALAETGRNGSRAADASGGSASIISDQTESSRSPFDGHYQRAKEELELILQNVSALLDPVPAERGRIKAEINERVGRFLAYARQGLIALVEELAPADTSAAVETRQKFIENISTLYQGREISFEAWKKIAGGYQDLGDLPRLVLAVRDDVDALMRVSQAIELFYITYAFSQTVEFLQLEPESISFVRFWDEVAGFFAETINDHDCFYLPWNYVRGVEKGVGFDRLGEQKLYEIAVARHAWLYRYFRLLLTGLTELKHLPKAEQDALLGNYLDGCREVAVGGDGQSEPERAWRAYNQLRECAFWRNDGFTMPVVFTEFDPGLISADKRVNLVFLFPVGRTHISRAFREGPTLCQELFAEGRPGVNLLVSRYDNFETVTGAQHRMLHCRSAHLYISKEELRAALVAHKGLSAEKAEAKLAELELRGSLTPKGIRIAARFTRSVLAGAVVPYHGNALYTSGMLEDEGLPYTVQSLIHSDITYDKSLYPELYRNTGVEMPPEIDWLTSYQTGTDRDQALQEIMNGRDGFEGLKAFAERYPIVLIKGAAESGARNLKVFEIGKGKGAWNLRELQAAALFIYERAGKQNMVVQEAARTTPEFWASPVYMSHFVDRQIAEWNTAVVRDRLPRSTIYGSLRIIASASGPTQPYDLTHLITLSSLQVATNVGRGGTLEPLRSDFIQEQFRQTIRAGLAAQVPLVMKALDHYAPVFEETYRSRRGRDAGKDLRGVSYGWPGYMMLDYLVTPTFEREGRLADIEPIYDGAGQRVGSRIVLEDSRGRFEGRITGWRFIHLEPNVGIGLWDRFNLREEYWEAKDAVLAGRPFNWDAVGKDDRIVLRNFAVAGEAYLRANLGERWASTAS